MTAVARPSPPHSSPGVPAPSASRFGRPGGGRLRGLALPGPLSARPHPQLPTYFARPSCCPRSEPSTPAPPTHPGGPTATGEYLQSGRRAPPSPPAGPALSGPSATASAAPPPSSTREPCAPSGPLACRTPRSVPKVWPQRRHGAPGRTGGRYPNRAGNTPSHTHAWSASTAVSSCGACSAPSPPRTRGGNPSSGSRPGRGFGPAGRDGAAAGPGCRPYRPCPDSATTSRPARRRNTSGSSRRHPRPPHPTKGAHRVLPPPDDRP